MPEENLNVGVEEKNECNCPICKVLRSEETKKFLAVILASFIGCSLAILVFAPKKHYTVPRHHAPYMKVIDRPLPPPGAFRHFDRQAGYHEFRGGHLKRHEFKGQNSHRRLDLKREAPRKNEFYATQRRPGCKCRELKAPEKPNLTPQSKQ